MQPTEQTHDIIILAPAYAILKAETAKWKQRNAECGGSLVGIQNDTVSYVLYAITTGPAANQSWAGITTDDSYQNMCLQAVCNHYRQLGVRIYYLGDYHLHPMYLPTFSSTDLAMFAEILADPDHAYLYGTPHILVTFKDREALYLPMWITRDRKSVKVEKANITALAPDDPQVVRILHNHPYDLLEDITAAKGECVPIETQRTALPGSVRGDSLLQRIAAESDEIRRVFGVTCQMRRGAHVGLYITANIDKRAFVAAIPSEFPLNPPTVFMKIENQREFEEVLPRRSWNSLARIADIFEEAMDSRHPIRSRTRSYIGTKGRAG